VHVAVDQAWQHQPAAQLHHAGQRPDVALGLIAHGHDAAVIDGQRRGAGGARHHGGDLAVAQHQRRGGGAGLAQGAAGQQQGTEHEGGGAHGSS